MQNRNPQKMAYIHFGGSTGFPISPAFFGQTFVMGNLTAVSRHVSPADRNITFVNKSKHDPLADHLVGEGAHRIAKELYNTDLRIGYGVDRVGDLVSAIETQMDAGFRPAIIFHYPLCDAHFAEKLSTALQERGIRDSAAMIYYLHTMADRRIFKLKGDSFNEKQASMFRAVDGAIAVSEAAMRSYLSTKARTKDGVFSLDPASSFVVRNGIDPFIYSVNTVERIMDARSHVGLNPDLDTVISFVGRLDRIKGSDFLVDVLRHYETSRNPSDSSVGFIIGSSSILRPDVASTPLKNIFKLERLIRERRLRVVLDISKFTRLDVKFKSVIEDIILQYARPHGFKAIEDSPAYGGMTLMPVQAMSDIYLHPARSEGLALSVVEAMFSTAFIIASRVGGIPEIVTHDSIGRLVDLPAAIGDGLQVAPSVYENAKKDFVSSLVSAIDSYRESPSKYYSMDAVRKTVKGFEGATMFDGFKDAINTILERKGGAHV